VLALRRPSVGLYSYGWPEIRDGINSWAAVTVPVNCQTSPDKFKIQSHQLNYINSNHTIPTISTFLSLTLQSKFDSMLQNTIFNAMLVAGVLLGTAQGGQFLSCPYSLKFAIFYLTDRVLHRSSPHHIQQAPYHQLQLGRRSVLRNPRRGLQ
jgi:hypothetical protein